MSRSLTRLQAIFLGVVVLAGLGLGTWGLFQVGERQQLWSETFTVQAGFGRLQGVGVGTPVRVRGLEAGVPGRQPAPAAKELRVRPTDDFPVTGDGANAAWKKTEWEPLHKRTTGGPPYETRIKVLHSKTGFYVLMDATDRKIAATIKVAPASPRPALARPNTLRTHARTSAQPWSTSAPTRPPRSARVGYPGWQMSMPLPDT